MKIIVTGCYGFVGHNVCKTLLAHGHHVIGADRLVENISPKAHRVEEVRRAGLKFVETNLSDARQVERLILTEMPDVIFHLAAQYPIRHNRQAIDQYLNSNVKALLNVFEFGRLAGVKRIVYSSSITARHLTTPSSLYAATKSFGEQCAHIYSRMKMEMVCLRLGAVYGPMMREDAGLWKVVRLVRNGKQLAMMTGFRSKHEMIFIDDLARCMSAFADVDLPRANLVETLAAHDHTADFGDAAILLGQVLDRKVWLPMGFTLTERKNMTDMSWMLPIIGTMPEIKLQDGMAKFMETMR